MPRCPGQDLRYWTPKDIYDIACISCGKIIEFWKDEPMRICPGCGREVRNPRIDLGCAKWCRFASECIGKAQGATPVPPVIDRLELLLEGKFTDKLTAKYIHEFYELAQKFLSGEKARPWIIQAGAVLAGAFVDSETPISRYQDDCIMILERAGIETEKAKEVYAIASAALCQTPLDCPEFDIISDIITIHKLKVDSSKISDTVFKTASGKQLSKQLMLKQD